MSTQSIRELSQALQRKTMSAVELTNDYLKRIRQHNELNVFISIDEDNALLEAKQADKLIQQGTTNPLTGIPMAHKDIFCTTTMRTTCGSKILSEFTWPYPATIVEKLRVGWMEIKRREARLIET